MGTNIDRVMYRDLKEALVSADPDRGLMAAIHKHTQDGPRDCFVAGERNALTRFIARDLPAAELDPSQRAVFTEALTELLHDVPLYGTTELTPPGWPEPVFVRRGCLVANQSPSPEPTLAQQAAGLFNFGLLAQRAFGVGADDTRAREAMQHLLGKLSAADKGGLIQSAVAAGRAALEPVEGMTESERKQLRSSAFTTLFELGKGVSWRSPVPGSTQSIEIHKALLDAVAREPDRDLAQHMARLVNQRDYKITLTSNQKDLALDAFYRTHPGSKRIDMANIVDGTGFVDPADPNDRGWVCWELACGQGDPFYSSARKLILDKEILGGRFEPVAGDPEMFQCTFAEPRTLGDGTVVKGARIRIRKLHEPTGREGKKVSDALDALGSGCGITIEAHSGFGRRLEWVLQRIEEEGLTTDRLQPILGAVCASADALDDITRAVPNALFFPTYGSALSFHSPDDPHGDFVRIDGLDATIATIAAGVEHDGNSIRIRNAIGSATYHRSHKYRPNFVNHTLFDYKAMLWSHLDADGDGVADALDVFYRCDLTRPEPVPEAEFVLLDHGPWYRLDGRAVRDAVLDANVSTHYNEFTKTRGDVLHKLVFAGFFDGADSDDLIRLLPGQNADQKDVWCVQVSSGLAHTSREALAVLVHYAYVLHLAERGVFGDLPTPEEQKVAAVAFAAARLRHVLFNDRSDDRAQDERVWKQFLELVQLPELSYSRLGSIVNAHHADANYMGNPEVVRRFLDTLDADTRSRLREPSCGWLPGVSKRPS